MAIYFTVDTHYGSQRHLELSKRPFKSVEEMDETMIKLYNEIVTDNDTVYHLGDFGDYKVRKRLNGKIILILGNYEINDIGTLALWSDIFENRRYLRRDDFIKIYGFNEVYDNMRIPELDNVYATHKPSDCIKTEFNLFAHIHEKQMVKRYGLNVGVDCHHFRPISTDDILFYKTAIEKYYDENVFD